LKKIKPFRYIPFISCLLNKPGKGGSEVAHYRPISSGVFSGSAGGALHSVPAVVIGALDE